MSYFNMLQRYHYGTFIAFSPASAMKGRTMGSEKVRSIRSVFDMRTLKAGRLGLAMDILAEKVDLDAIGLRKLDFIVQNGKEAAEQFTHFIRIIEKLIVEKRRSTTTKTDCTALFDLVQFMYHHGLEIEGEDERSAMLEDVDSSAVAPESMAKGEAAIDGEEHVKQLKHIGHIRLDAILFKTLWENQHLIPEHWKGTTDDPKYIFFDGTVFRNKHGRYVICMYWDKNEKWKWTYCRLGLGGGRAEDLSVVLKG